LSYRAPQLPFVAVAPNAPAGLCCSTWKPLVFAGFDPPPLPPLTWVPRDGCPNAPFAVAFPRGAVPRNDPPRAVDGPRARCGGPLPCPRIPRPRVDDIVVTPENEAKGRHRKGDDDPACRRVSRCTSLFTTSRRPKALPSWPHLSPRKSKRSARGARASR
jgi:hypothetical protein